MGLPSLRRKRQTQGRGKGFFCALVDEECNNRVRCRGGGGGGGEDGGES